MDPQIHCGIESQRPRETVESGLVTSREVQHDAEGSNGCSVVRIELNPGPRAVLGLVQSTLPRQCGASAWGPMASEGASSQARCASRKDFSREFALLPFHSFE